MCLPGTVETVREAIEREGPPRIDRRQALLAGGLAALGAVVPGTAAAAPPRGGGRHVRDLTHTLRAGFPVYGNVAVRKETLTTVPQNGFYAQQWSFNEHSGTHMDAPAHFVANGRHSPDIKLRELFVRVAVIDISRRAQQNADAVVTVDDLRRYERRHGRIPRGAGVFMYSGWESRVGDQERFRNTGADGKFHFPGFSEEAVRWLLERRNPTCIGVDTLSLDPGNSTTFPVHKLLLGADRYGLEGLANLKRIPARGATAYVGLVPWQDGSGGPCRVIARW